MNVASDTACTAIAPYVSPFQGTHSGPAQAEGERPLALPAKFYVHKGHPVLAIHKSFILLTPMPAIVEDAFLPENLALTAADIHKMRAIEENVAQSQGQPIPEMETDIEDEAGGAVGSINPREVARRQ